MSRKSHLIGGVFCLVGGYVIGYTSGVQNLLKGALGVVNSIVNALPFLPGLVNQLTPMGWYLAVGSILIIIGIVLVVLGGDGKTRAPKQPDKQAIPSSTPLRPPGQSCKFCGADMKGSTTYCPSCGKSQS